MKKLVLIILLLNFSSYAQQWDWAVTADSVYGDQETKMICKSNNDLFALLHQKGPSVINNTYLDSGNVIVKINLAGQIQYAKHFPGNISCIYADNNGTTYFIGLFSDTLNFLGSVLISHGGTDIFYGALDAAGNKLWITTAGGLQNDFGNGIITDTPGNLFVTGQIKDNYFVGTQLFAGNSGLNTYLLRHDFTGNYIAAYTDSTGTISKGLNFQKDINGTIFLCNSYYTYPCPYICGGTNIIKIDPLNYSLTIKAQFNAYSYQHLHSWAVNIDSTISANFNTGSHYTTTYNIHKVTAGNVRTLRKHLGNGYDGKLAPCITKGSGSEMIFGGGFGKALFLANQDTLWYDNLIVLPDTFLSNLIIGGVDATNQFTWLLRSYGKSAPTLSSLISDEQGQAYCAGNYNNHFYWLPQYSLPQSVTFGNTVLPAENNYLRFFVAGAETTLGTTIAENKILLSDLSAYPNPSSGIFTVSFQNKTTGSKICVYDVLGNCVLSKNANNSETETIDLSAQVKGIYFIEINTDQAIERKKIILE